MKHSEFKDKARAHQIEFKCNNPEINVEIGKFYRAESSLRREDCQDKEGNYLIFFSGFRKELTQEANQKGVSNKAPMVTNLLRSEHIPYNIFLPMKHDMEGTARLFNRILGEERIEKIDALCIEYNPGGLKDKTAFDCYIEYTPKNGNSQAKGGIGIEVKYTEGAYGLKKGTTEWENTHNNLGIHLNDNYRIPSEKSGWFKKEYIENVPSADTERLKNHVVANKFRQIWRNHLLGAYMIQHPCESLNPQNPSMRPLTEFTSLTVYPQGNGHFDNLWEAYESKLTDEGLKTFKHITYEELFDLMEEVLSPVNIPQLSEWVNYLKTRYLVE